MLPITYILEQQGLSQQEARVYLATLELGQAPASQIARKLGENRVTVYSTLQSLLKKGIIVQMVKNKVTEYIAISPEKLLQISQEKTDMLGGIVKDLLLLSKNNKAETTMQFYEGIEGLKMCYEDTLQYPKSTLKSFLGYGNVEKTMRKWLNYTYLPQRLKKNITAKVIIPATLKEKSYDYATNIDQKNYASLTFVKYVTDSDFMLENEINLYGEDKVLIVMFGTDEMKGLIIRSKQLYKTLDALFDVTRKI